MNAPVHEALERHEHMEHHSTDSHGKRAALIIGVLAAILAVCEMEERSSQNGYLSHHITASDQFAFYQARQARALLLTQTATVLRALPDTPDTKKAIGSAEGEAKRLLEDSDRGNGAKQILARADAETHERDHDLHKYEWFEIVTSVLQIAIVLASVSVVTKLTQVLYVGLALGVVATALAGAVFANLV